MPTGRMKWDTAGTKYYENGNDHAVLYVAAATAGYYEPGVPWNGWTGFSESPDGAEATDLWADNIKYASMRSAENYKGTIEAYMYPDEFTECDGSAKVAGIYVGQQKRKPFGVVVRTNVSNDAGAEEYKYHLVYGATASPSEKGYETVNDSPDAITFSWEFDTVPVAIGTIGGVEYKPTAVITIDTRNFTTTSDQTKLADFLDVIYGVDADSTVEPAVTATDALLPSPSDVIKYFSGTLTKSELIAAATEPTT